MADSGDNVDKSTTNVKSIKKPFNKKLWREQKYSTKFKVQKWEEKRKKRLEQKYHKELKKDGIGFTKRTDAPENNLKLSRLKKAQNDFEIQKNIKRERAEDARKVKEEKQRRIKEFREKKAERFRILNRKTRKGQPVMRGRLELLQQKIEKLVAENKL